MASRLMGDLDMTFDRPIFLNPNNFTPLVRTPWAGEMIAEQFKDSILPEVRGQKIGEVWEISCDPAFPSTLKDSSDVTLAELIAQSPEPILSKRLVQDNIHSCEILLKTLNANSPLSLQIHPRDGDPWLKPDECGKPESWYVLDHRPGAGIYLGFKSCLTKAELLKALESGANIKELLQFVEVKQGDYFEILPGVPHAVGEGVLLLEPQRIAAKQSGKTYRMWDWCRLYDKNGKLDPVNGKPRELHIEAAMELVDPENQWGPEFVAQLRRVPDIKNFGNCQIKQFPENPYYQVYIIEFDNQTNLSVKFKDGFCACLNLRGRLNIQCLNNQTSCEKGQPFILPAALSRVTLSTQDAASQLAIIVPRGTQLEFVE